MPIDQYFKLPVLLLFNLDSSWSAQEQEEVFELSSTLDDAITSSGYQTTLVPVTDNNLDKVLSKFNPLEHIVFNWCESLPGIAHSEWMVARYLEKAGFTFTGADSDTLALAGDKPSIKRLLDDHGIPTPHWQLYDNASDVKWDRFPAIVKPSREHCSEGIDRNAVVTEDAELRKRIEYIIKKYRQPALVEDFIDGRELHVTLWENGNIDMLPPAEMEFSSYPLEQDRICSYDAKFIPESDPYQRIRTVLPAPLSDDELVDIERVCRAAFVAAGCRDYARIDLRVRDGVHYVIDINPNSDLSPDTTTVAAAELAGYTYGEFAGRIITFASWRHPAFGETKPFS